MEGRLGGMYRRAAVTLTPPVVAGAITVGVFASLADRLPDRVDGASGILEAMPWIRVLAEGLAWSVLVLIWGAVWLYVRRGVQGARRWIAATTWVGSVLIVGDVLQLVVRNLDLAGAPARPAPWWTSPFAVVPVLVVVALVAWWAMGPDPEQPEAAGGPRPGAPRLQLSDGERALFVRTILSRRGLASAILWAVLAAWQAALGSSYIVVGIFVLAAIIVAARSWARVLVDEHGVQVIQPLLRRVLVGAQLRTVVEARAGTLDPRALPRATYGAFHTQRQSGYRATAGGEVLRLQLSDGRELIVTVPGAATAAGLVNTQLDRRRAIAGERRC